MGCYNFLGVLEIINGSIKILPKNGKFMALIATLGILLNSFAFLFYTFFYKPLHSSIYATENNSNLNEFEFEILYSVILYIVTIAFIFAYARIAHIVNQSIIYVSAMSLKGHDISLKNLLLKVKRSFKRTPSTSSVLHTNKTVHWIIVFSTVLIVFTLLAFPSYFLVTILASIPLMVPASIYSIYESVVSVLAYVMLAIEENCNGIEALTEAERLVKERRADGFVLSLALNLFILISFLVYVTTVAKWPSKEIVVALFLICIAYLLIVFMQIAYTFLYFKCKESHGEEITLEDKMDYGEEVTAPLLSEDVP